jgi:hypothetical protein
MAKTSVVAQCLNTFLVILRLSGTATSDNIQRDKMAKYCCEASGRSSVVEFLLCYLKIKGSIPSAELARVERKWLKVAAIAQWLNTCLAILKSMVQDLLLSWHSKK